jgi:VIT1/CCC1 family predicted Fe2+/Mn2+ transporter
MRPHLPIVPTRVLAELAARDVASAIAAAIGLFVIGAFITLMTGKNPVVSGLRQVLFGLAAAAVTFGIGRLIGVSLS